MRFLKPLDTEAVDYALDRVTRIITLEDGVVSGGLYGAVAEYVGSRQDGSRCRIEAMGMPDRFVEQGTPGELYSECGYNTDDILRKILGSD